MRPDKAPELCYVAENHFDVFMMIIPDVTSVNQLVFRKKISMT